MITRSLRILSQPFFRNSVNIKNLQPKRNEHYASSVYDLQARKLVKVYFQALRGVIECSGHPLSPALDSYFSLLDLVSKVGKWVYREAITKVARHEHLAADGLNAFMWWWIFVHVWYQPGHIFGEYDYPEPEKWSDAQLGVVDVELLE